jgi:hypothetical protein
MPLSKEDRIELLARARQAKANKKQALEQEPVVVNVEMPAEQPPTPKVKNTRKKNEIAPLPEPVKVILESESDSGESIEVPIPKKKALPSKWLKLPKVEQQKYSDEKVSKEQYAIDDDKPQNVDNIVVPAKKEVKKARAPRASAPSRTLTITAEPAPIKELFQDLEQTDMKYRPKQVKQAPSAPISIKRQDPPLQLFHY